MRVHYLQHVASEGLGSIEAWLLQNNHELTSTRLYKAEKLPNLDAFDFLIVLGGPMSVNDEAELPWLADEKVFIRNAIDGNKKVLGICLGAQLIANALGAKVHRNNHKEIGWFPAQGLKSKDSSTFQFPDSMKVFHWHGDTFELPHGAIHLAQSEACRYQAFQYGHSVIALQFHLEMTPTAVQSIVTDNRHELTPSKYVQTEEEILSAEPERYQSINHIMYAVLFFLTSTTTQ